MQLFSPVSRGVGGFIVGWLVSDLLHRASVAICYRGFIDGWREASGGKFVGDPESIGCIDRSFEAFYWGSAGFSWTTLPPIMGTFLGLALPLVRWFFSREG